MSTLGSTGQDPAPLYPPVAGGWDVGVRLASRGLEYGTFTLHSLVIYSRVAPQAGLGCEELRPFIPASSPPDCGGEGGSGLGVRNAEITPFSTHFALILNF